MQIISSKAHITFHHISHEYLLAQVYRFRDLFQEYPEIMINTSYTIVDDQGMPLGEGHTPNWFLARAVEGKPYLSITIKRVQTFIIPKTTWHYVRLQTDNDQEKERE